MESQNDRAKKCLRTWIAIVTTCLLGLGCASPTVNPATARAHTGYVDFYAANDAELSWEIRQVESDGGSKQVFFEFDPLPDNILRLAFKPGHYRLRVTIINRPILGPGPVEVEVKNGMVTPVRVTFVDAGTGQVLEKQVQLRARASGRFGRGTSIIGHETQVFRVQTEAGEALPYQIKSQMPYAE